VATGLRALPAPDLDALILKVHAADNRRRLAALYEEAGAREVARGQIDAACFFWTQAWIFALDAAEKGVVERVERRLAAHGRLSASHSGAISSTAEK
jgi:hypothetical protein